MASQKFDFGMIGLGTMGRNFLLNVADNGYSIIGLDNDPEKASALESEAGSAKVKGTTSLQDFVEQIEQPRRIMMLVPAGKIVDIVIEDLLPLLQPDDLVIDGGNSHFDDTDRRLQYLADKQIQFLGVGVSGGSEGARLGPSIMPGGSRKAYELVQPIFEKVSAKVGSQPCVDFMGNGSAGHYVKMVHNGIEYAMMQLIAESYDLLRHVGGFSHAQLRDTYDRWNNGVLNSFLVEITAEIFGQPDDLGNGSLVEMILDKAKQKGTGKWTSQHALDVGIPTPSIDAAVTMRQISGLQAQRLAISKKFQHLSSMPTTLDPDEFATHVEHALLFSFIISYSQGLHLLREASIEKKYDLDLEACARIWRGGCIIRAGLLEDIRRAYSEVPGLEHLLDSDIFAQRLQATQSSCRLVLKTAIDSRIPALTFGSTLGYFDAFCSQRLPLNLVQAQRDYFGSHTYQRIDRDGNFHTNWTKQPAESK